MNNKGLFVLVFLLSLLISEIGLRFFLPTKKFIFQPGLTYTFYPNPKIIKGVDTVSCFSINKNGLRGSCFQNGAMNILVLGGSTTECLYLDDKKCWTSLLENKLIKNGCNVNIGSGGKSSRTSYEHLSELKLYTEQFPFITHVIVMNGLNDFLKVLSQQSSNKKNEDLQYITDSISQIIFTKSYTEKKPILLQLVQKAFSQKVNQNIQDPQGNIYKSWISNRLKSNPKIDSVPDLKNALQLYKNRQETIINFCESKKIDLTFIEQTAQWSYSNDSSIEKCLWMGGIGNFQKERNSIYYSQAALRKGLSLFNSELETLCRTKNVSFIKTDSILYKNPENFYDDCHFTNRGSVELSAIIFKQILNKIKK